MKPPGAAAPLDSQHQGAPGHVRSVCRSCQLSSRLAQGAETAPVEATPGVTASLISPKESAEHAVGQAFGVGLSLQNQTDAVVIQPINAETVQMTATLAGREPVRVPIQWSVTEVALSPGMLSAALGSIALDSTGSWVLSLPVLPVSAAEAGAPEVSEVTTVVK